EEWRVAHGGACGAGETGSSIPASGKVVWRGGSRKRIEEPMREATSWGHMRRAARAAFAALALGLLALPAAAQNGQLTVLHFNDFYELTPKNGVGGAAELMTLIERERAAHTNTLTVLGGDFLSPSVMSGITKGAQMVDVLNAMGVDMVVFGNHE